MASRPDITSFAGGLPAPEYFPIDAMRAAADRVLSNYGRQALQYAATEGVGELRELIAATVSALTLRAARPPRRCPPP